MFQRDVLSFFAAVCSAGLVVAGQPADKQLPSDRPIEQAIDHYVDQAVKDAKLRTAPLADDATILRRLTLDLNGRIPTLGETTAYLADPDPQKKAKLVDRLMSSSAFVRHQTTEFLTFLQLQEPTRRSGPGKGALRDYVLAGFTDNRPWDKMFRELMLPDENDAKLRGAGEFLKSRVRDLNRMTIDVSVIFFGVNVSCAQCHDHPHVQAWTQDHFYGMKAFLARTFEAGGRLGERDVGVVKYIPNKGTEKIAPVMFLTGKTIDAPGMKDAPKEEKKKRGDGAKGNPPAPPKFSLRAKLVDTALEPGQREFFSRAIVNRLFHRFYARGLVMPLDQMHTANRPSHPDLLAWLARDLVEHGYDLRRLTRGLVLSNAYARTSRWDGDDVPEERYFALGQVRALTPMQMAASLRLATTDPESLPADGAALEKRLEALEKSAERFAVHFPQPGEHFQVGVDEAMLFVNNEKLMAELLDGPGTLPARLKQIADLDKRADLAVRTVLGRAARPDEIKALAEYMRRRADRPDAACQQIVWALLTGAEFRFNH